MNTLTLIYAADKSGNFTDPETGECWNIPADREMFRETIKGRCIIAGARTFFKDWRGLIGAKVIRVVTRQTANTILPKTDEERVSLGAIDKALIYKSDCAFYFGGKPLQTLYSCVYCAGIHDCDKDKRDEIFCVGGKETIESFAPFASRVLVTLIDEEPSFSKPWLPFFIEREQVEWRTQSKDSVRFKKEMSTHKILGQRYDFRRLQPIELK